MDGSRCAVGSSISSSGAPFRNARAIATRCAWPPESPNPPSPTGVSSPCGRLAEKLSIRAWRAASSTSASVASGRANRMFSRIVPANSTGFCPIHAVNFDNACGTIVVMSAPLIVTRPLSGRTNPSRISITVDLPAPDGPASTSISPGGT